MSRIALTTPARADVVSIWEHLADGAGLDTADRVASELQDAMHRLAEHPGIGHARPDLTAAPVLFWLVYSYLIVYLPETSPLQIVRVLHASRDVRRLLGLEEEPRP